MYNFEEEQYTMFKKKYENLEKTCCIIDNGSFEIKAGFQDKLCLITRNRIYKKGNKYDFEVSVGATRLEMYNYDTISNLIIAEQTFCALFKFLEIEKNKKCGKIVILTTMPDSTTDESIAKILIEKFGCSEVFLGFDFMFCYNRYFVNKDTLVICISASNTYVCVVQNNNIVFLHKLCFGANDLMCYINYTMHFQHKMYKNSYEKLLDHVSVAYDYSEEAFSLFQKIKSKKYEDCLFLEEENQSIADGFNIKETEEKSVTKEFILPVIDYNLLKKEDIGLQDSDIKEKKKQKLIFHSTFARLKSKIDCVLNKIGKKLADNEEMLEKTQNFEFFLERKKHEFVDLKRRLKERETLRKNANNRKTLEAVIKYKEKNLTVEEFKLQQKIMEAENKDMEQELIVELDRRAKELSALDPNYVLFESSTVDILKGENIRRSFLSIEKYKWGEIFFNPSILHIDQMGLSDCLELVSKQFEVENVLLCGGMAKMKGLYQRVYKELICRSKTGKINIKIADDPQKDPFYGADTNFCHKKYTKDNL